MKDDKPIADEHSLKRSNIVFLALLASGIGLFALRWFDLIPESFDALFFVLVIAGMAVAFTSIPMTLQVYKQRHYEKDKQ